jgi:hypothetical protein
MSAELRRQLEFDTALLENAARVAAEWKAVALRAQGRALQAVESCHDHNLRQHS